MTRFLWLVGEVQNVDVRACQVKVLWEESIARSSNNGPAKRIERRRRMWRMSWIWMGYIPNKRRICPGVAWPVVERMRVVMIVDAEQERRTARTRALITIGESLELRELVRRVGEM